MAARHRAAPSQYLVASCRNLSSCCCKKLLLGGPLSFHGLGGLEVHLAPKPDRGGILSICQGAFQAWGSWEQAKARHIILVSKA